MNKFQKLFAPLTTLSTPITQSLKCDAPNPLEDQLKNESSKIESPQKNVV